MLDALDRAGTVLGFILTCLSIAAAVLAYMSRSELKRLINRWLRRRKFAHAGRVVIGFERRVDAAVILVGLNGTQAEWIVRHLKPRRVALVFTPEGRAAAAELAKKLENQTTFDPTDREIEAAAPVIEHLLSIEQTKTVVRHHLRRLLKAGFSRHRIFVDTTGGTAPMSMGAFQAAEELGISSIYTMGLATTGDRQGMIDDPEDPTQAEPRFMSDHTGEAA